MKSLHKIVLSAILACTLQLAPQALKAQVRITGDVAVTRMVEKHVELNSKVKTIPGYRVQIASFAGVNSKNSAFDLRDRFNVDYPDMPVYIVFDEPNFKVKVGDFRSRLEAYAYLQQIKEFYKGYIIKDNIFPEPPAVEEYAPDDGDISEEEQ
ncbi:MAG: SPOR domain-containing protein [Bacteroidales bacterium]|nr:SPOR domain-containing protein [Bacteroidales bacterium]